MQVLKIIIVALLFSFLGYISFVQAANSPNVVINEIAWMGTTVSYNDEWIELRNNTGQEINLDGWILKAADGTPEIKLTRTVLVGGFYLLERTDDNTVPGVTADQIYVGALNNSGEILELYDNLGNLVDRVDASSGWPAGDNTTKQTMERVLAAPGAANWQTGANAGGTPKAENSEFAETNPPQTSPQESATETIIAPPAAAEENTRVEPVQTPSKIIYPSGIVINEILPSPTGPDEEEEWIEIFNENNFGVNLSGWQITDIVGGIKIYAFPEETTIEAAGFLILFRPATKITLNNSGDGLNLVQPDGKIIDSINYENAPRGKSYGRFKSGWAWASAPTPGSANALIVPTPGPEKKSAEDGPPQTELAAIGESLDLARGKQLPKNSGDSLLLLGAIFTSLFSGVIILILKHVRA